MTRRLFETLLGPEQGPKEFHHVRITLKSDKSHGEVKLDLTKGQLENQFIRPYELGTPIVVKGKAIPPTDIDRIEISVTNVDSSIALQKIDEVIREKRIHTNTPRKWLVIDTGINITDEIIKGPPGYKATQTAAKAKQQTKPCIFIGHGHNKIWARLKIYLQDELKLDTINYEKEPRAGDSIVPILNEMLNQATFAVLVLTAEDKTAEGLERARQNVIHEAGLFQGRLGFKKAILLVQEGLEDFTNIDGLQVIRFKGDDIEHTFYELRRVLEREKVLNKPQ